MATTPTTQFVPPTVKDLTDQLAKLEQDLAESTVKEGKLSELVILQAKVTEAKATLDASKRCIAEYERRLSENVPVVPPVIPTVVPPLTTP